jgi:thiol-disulfide isomerase/thioredoxin
MRWFRNGWSVAAALCVGGAVLAGSALLLGPHGAGILSGRQPPTLASSTAPPKPLPAELDFTPLPTPRAVPALAFVDGEGAPKALADFKGRVVLLNIWATWCVPCRAEMSALDRLQAKLGGPDFQFVALSIDRKGLDVVKPFYAELGLGSLGIYLDRSASAAHALDTVGVPTTLLIDRDGRELGRKLGPAPWDEPDAVALIRRAIEGPR